MNRRHASRREFLKRTGGAVAGAIAIPYILTSKALGDDTTAPASERVTLGHIGVGGRGGGVLWEHLNQPDTQCVAVCDAFRSRREDWATRIDDFYTERAGTEQKVCTAYADFRDLLARDDIDAVTVGTHDGWHVPVAIAAARAGKDAYVEKPLGMSVEQDILCREVFRERGAIFQYGTQQRSLAHCRLGCELVRNGYIGEVESIVVLAPQGGHGGSTDAIPVPEDLDYEMWLGSAPWSPYTADRCTPFGCYWVYDNSIGYIAGWGAHPLDILDWAWGSDEMMPVEYSGTGVIPTEGLFDVTETWDVTCTYPNGVPLRFQSAGGDQTRLDGTEGWVSISRGGLDAEPKSLLSAAMKDDEIHLVQSAGQARNFVDSVKTRTPAVSPVESAARSDIISQLGDITIRTGRTIRWDLKAETIIDDETASRMLTRPMRAPWTL